MTARTIGRLAMVVAMVLGGACDGGGGRPSAADEPRDDEIRSLIDVIWTATGVDMAHVHVGDYTYTFLPDNRACAELDVDDRWFGARSSSVAPGIAGQRELETTITAALRDEGFDVEIYRSRHPESGLRAFNAVNDESRAYGYLSEDGFADVNVRAGPCAPVAGGFDEDRFEPDT